MNMPADTILYIGEVEIIFSQFFLRDRFCYPEFLNWDWL